MEVSSRDQKVVILDFDGTLADIMPLIHEIARDYGLPEISDEQLDRLRKGTLRQALREVNIKSWQLPGLLKKARKLIYDRRGDLKLFDGVEDLIRSLEKDSWHVYILSTNRRDTIESVLEKSGIHGGITILKRPGLFGKSQRIANLLKVKNYSRKNVWLVGDETRDMMAANKSGINSIAVNWGLQHEEILKKYDPKYILTDIKQLQKTLNKLR